MLKVEGAKKWEGFPCHWCGVMTIRLDAERFHVCEFCAGDERKLSTEEMRAKYPNYGQDSRNPEYFEYFHTTHSGGSDLLHS